MSTLQQRVLLGGFEAREAQGLTVADVRDGLGLHHGAASGALSRMHAAGVICRTTEKRDGNVVYTLPQFVGDRTTEEQGKRPSGPPPIVYPHRSCGAKPGPLGRVCANCDRVDGYHARRRAYLDEVEKSDRQNLVETPVEPVVTFGWWLAQWARR